MTPIIWAYHGYATLPFFSSKSVTLILIPNQKLLCFNFVVIFNTYALYPQ